MKVTRLIKKIVLKTEKLRFKLLKKNVEITELDDDCLYQLAKTYSMIYKSLHNEENQNGK